MMKPKQVCIDEAASDHGDGRHEGGVGVADRVHGRPVVGQVDDGRLRGLAVQVDDAKDPFGNFRGSRTLKWIMI